MANPCIFNNHAMSIETMVHGDDFMSIGEKSALEWFRNKLEAEFEIKTTIIGWKDNMENEMRALNRILRIVEDGVEYEADQRHAKLVIKQMALETTNPVMTPVDEEIETKFMDDQGRDMQDVCDREHSVLYKSVGARLNYLSLDRPDCQYGIKEICRRMADTTWRYLARIKQMGRYLLKRPRPIRKYRFQGDEGRVRVISDANWAGCKLTRKSTSGGCVYFGQTLHQYME